MGKTFYECSHNRAGYGTSNEIGCKSKLAICSGFVGELVSKADSANLALNVTRVSCCKGLKSHLNSELTDVQWKPSGSKHTKQKDCTLIIYSMSFVQKLDILGASMSLIVCFSIVKEIL